MIRTLANEAICWTVPLPTPVAPILPTTPIAPTGPIPPTAIVPFVPVADTNFVAKSPTHAFSLVLVNINTPPR